MKTREYTITSGSYDSYRILARVRGPETPALSTLYKAFCEQFGVNPRQGSMSASQLYSRILSFGAAKERANKAGFGLRGSWAEAFLDWLIQTRQFEKIDACEFHIDG